MSRQFLVPASLAAAVAGCASAAHPPPQPAPPSAYVPAWNPSPPAAAKDALAVVVEGGVSLGAYEGGFLYALSEQLKRARLRPPLYAGASAGTIDAVLFGVEMCHGTTPEPTASPLHTVWMDASLAALRRGTHTSPTAVFPQDGVRSIAQILRTRLTDGAIRGCDFVVAAETSRLRPRLVPVEGNDALPDLAEPFVVRITAGDDGLPEIRNYVADDPVAPHALLPFPVDQLTDAARSSAIDLLIDLVLASSAFPGAFPPVMLRHCLTDPKDPGKRQGGPTECGALPIAVRTPFIDGGVLDNVPVGLAIQTALSGFAGDGHGGGSWGPPRAPAGHGQPASLAYLVVNTDNDAYDAVTVRPERTGTFVDFAAEFAGSFVDAARNRALLDTLAQDPDLLHRTAVSQLHPRLASAFLDDFFGFFDGRLRDFDFTAGMYDAARFIGSGGLAALLADEARPSREPPDLASMKTPSEGWRKLACMAQAYGPPLAPGAYTACAPSSASPLASAPWQSIDAPAIAPDFESFVELLQASLDELYSQCLCAQALSEHPSGPACAALLVASRVPPRLRSEWTLDAGWPRECSARSGEGGTVEDALAYAVRRLAAYGFAGASASATNTMIRERIGALADDGVSRQPLGDRLVAAFAGAPVVDSAFGYVPPRYSAHFVTGLGTELGITFGRWLRATAALQAKGSANTSFAATPLAGIDWNVGGLPAAFQLHPFARLGFQFGRTGPDDVVTGSSCAGRFDGHPENCVIGQAGLAALVFEILRLQGVWEQSRESPARALDHLRLELGLQANWPMANP